MKNPHHPKLSIWLTLGLSVFALTNVSAQTEHVATSVGTEMSASPGFSVSDADLLQTSFDSVNASILNDRSGGEATDAAYLQGWESIGESSLRDGAWYDNPGNSQGSAMVENYEFAEYLLDLATNPGGYTITAVDLYSNWGSGQGRDEIRVTVSFSLDGTPTNFDQTLVGSPGDPLFVYNPPTETQGKLSLTEFSVSGVAAVRFDWPSLQENNAVGYSEIDVFGTSTGGDVDPPTLSSSNPASGATDVATVAELVFTINEDVPAGTGIIDLRTSTPDASVETSDVTTSSQLSFAGRDFTITPTNPLLPGVEYYVVVPPGAVDDLASNGFAGFPALPDAGAFRFTTDATAPVLRSAEPLLNGLPTSDITLQFNEMIQLGTGQITIHLASDDSVVETINVPNAAVTSDENSVVADITDLAFGTAYYVSFTGAAITDLSGNAAPAVSDNRTIAFTTVATTLIHRWEFEDDTNDSVGTHDGTRRGGGGFEEGQIGQALNTGAGMNVNQSSLPATNFTMACWINPTTTGGIRHIAGTRRGDTEGAQLKMRDGKATVRFQSGMNVVLAAPDPLVADEWTHIAFSVDGTSGLTLYVNGSPVGTDAAGTGHTVVDNFTVGTRPDVIGENFSSLVDDLRIYAEVLSGAQIAALANNGPEPLAPPEIVSITYDGTEVTLTWTSNPGEAYSVFFSKDLKDIIGNIDDGVEASAVGTTTEYSFSISFVGQNLDRLFFRVVRNPPEPE